MEGLNLYNIIHSTQVYKLREPINTCYDKWKAYLTIDYYYIEGITLTMHNITMAMSGGKFTRAISYYETLTMVMSI